MIGKTVSWNVRGINDLNKCTVIEGYLGRWKSDLVYLQESKLDRCDEGILRSLWKRKNVGWHVIPVKGSAGGLILMWNEERVQSLDVLSGEATLSCLAQELQGRGIVGIYWCLLSW